MTAQSSHTHTHTLAAYLLKRRTCGFGLTCKHRQRLRGAATAAVASGAAPKQRETKSVHSLPPPPPSPPPSLFLSTQLHRVLLWVCLTTSSCCWQRGQGSLGSLTATTGCNNKSTWNKSTWNSHFIFSLKLLHSLPPPPPFPIQTLLFPLCVHGSNFAQRTSLQGGLVYPHKHLHHPDVWSNYRSVERLTGLKR